MKIRTFFKNLFASKDLTTGPVVKGLLIFTVPIFLSYLFQQFYSLTDAMIVGQTLSAPEVNGVNNTGSLVFIIMQFAFGCTAGFSVITANKKGAKDANAVRQSFFVQTVLGIIVSIVLTIIALSSLNPLLGALGITSTSGLATYTAAYDYLFIIFAFTISNVMYNLVCSVLRAIGDSITPLIFLIISTILNIGLDLLFIIPLKMGVQGAALATGIAQTLAAIGAYIYTFIRYKELIFKREDFFIKFKFYKKHLKLGLPLGFQFSILAVGFIIMQSVIIKFDTLNGVIAENGPAQLGINAAFKVNNFSITSFSALGTAILSFVGQCKGMNKYDRIRTCIKKSMIISVILMIVTCAIVLPLTIDGLFLSVFYSADKITPEAIRYGSLYLWIVTPLMFLLGFLFIFRSAIQGVKKPKYPLLSGFVELIARIVIALFVPVLFNNMLPVDATINILTTPLPYIGLILADIGAWIVGTSILGAGVIRHIFLYKGITNTKDEIELTQN
ncbi:MAG TPA: MATE family efflux transporter [Candidatus Onthovivens sp.]|nr:MATE family efflux transporter [Candidatus Onthovivens sp.]